MEIAVIAVGRLRRGPEETLFQDYARRLPWPLIVREVEDRRSDNADTRRQREGELILAALDRDCWLIALDERGRTLDSRGFAEQFGRWREQGRRQIAFAIGGADGHSDEVLQRADFRLSLGAMTWPHMLARVLLAEQLFRATTILSGHPYHRD